MTFVSNLKTIQLPQTFKRELQKFKDLQFSSIKKLFTPLFLNTIFKYYTRN